VPYAAVQRRLLDEVGETLKRKAAYEADVDSLGPPRCDLGSISDADLQNLLNWAASPAWLLLLWEDASRQVSVEEKARGVDSSQPSGDPELEALRRKREAIGRAYLAARRDDGGDR
jgi:hypothetical protein